MQLFFLFALVVGTFGAPIACPFQNITVTTRWYQPPTSAVANCDNFYVFNIPSDSYANIKISVTGQSNSDSVYINDNYGTEFYLMRGSDFPGDPTRPPTIAQSAEYNFPSLFNVHAGAGYTTVMKVEITVTVKKLPQATSVTQVTTNVNKQPAVIYLKDLPVGTSYTFTSKSSTSKIAIAVDLLPGYGQTNLTNIFITDGKIKSTVYALLSGKYVSKTNQVTIFLAEPINLVGAILVTDYENVKGFFDYGISFVPAGQDNPTRFAFMQASYDTNPKPAAVTVIGEKNGATPITVRQLNDYGDGGKFSYMSGGPVANFATASAPLANSNLPKTLSGTLNTFIVSQGAGNVKYSI